MRYEACRFCSHAYLVRIEWVRAAHERSKVIRSHGADEEDVSVYKGSADSAYATVVDDLHSKEIAMSDAPNNANTGASTPNFEKLDQTEQIYAPEQVPNNPIPEHEIDADKGTDASTGAGDAAPAGGGNTGNTGRGIS